jgi:hypothetical protein
MDRQSSPHHLFPMTCRLSAPSHDRHTRVSTTRRPYYAAFIRSFHLDQLAWPCPIRCKKLFGASWTCIFTSVQNPHETEDRWPDHEHADWSKRSGVRAAELEDWWRNNESSHWSRSFSRLGPACKWVCASWQCHLLVLHASWVCSFYFYYCQNVIKGIRKEYDSPACTYV